MTDPVIDLNADLGERTDAIGAVIDDALLQVVTSANVACGGHAGDAEAMARVCALAAARGVAVGAQVSYVDREGFGRHRLDVAAAELTEQLAIQLHSLDDIAVAAGTAVTYVKPHGALYHAAIDDLAHAGAVVDAACRHAALTGRPLAVLGQDGSALLTLAGAAGLRPVTEAFADRGYRPDGRLVPRGEPGDLVLDPDTVVARVRRMALRHEVTTVAGGIRHLAAQSICLHSDTPGAAALARQVRDGLWVGGVSVRSFTRPPGLR